MRNKIAVAKPETVNDILTRVQNRIKESNMDGTPISYKTDEEVYKDIKRAEYLKRLGIDVYTTDDLTDNDPSKIQSDKNWALSYVLAGKPVPKDMEERLIRAEQERLRREHATQVQRGKNSK